MEKDDVLGVMSSYDFSRPLNTVIYLEDNDSDEDTQIDDDNKNINSKESSKNKEIHTNGNTVDSDLNSCHYSKNQTSNTNDNPLSRLMDQITELSNSKSPERKLNNCNSSLKRGINEDHIDQSNKKRCHTAEETDPKNHDEPPSSNKSNLYIKSTLKIISENLLHIVAAKARIYNKALAATSIEQKLTLDNQFISIKCCFFKMCYCVTVTMLLPLENNPGFINSLLHSTLQYARLHGMQSSREELLEIYLEMLFWTKEYRRKCIPPLSGQNRQPEVLTPYSQFNLSETTPIPQTTRPQMGISTKFSDNHNILQTTEVLQTTRTCQNYNMNAQHQSHAPEKGNSAVKNYPHVSPPYNAHQVHSSNANQNQSNYINKSCQNPTLLAHLLRYNNSPSPMSGKEGHSRRTPNRYEAASPPYHAHIIVQNANTTADITPNITITNRSAIPNDKHCQIQQIEGHQRENRSLSTDSGFASPLFTGKESMTDSPEQLNLLITEVTSLNPKVQYLNVGSCIVCQKPTRKVCLACYKEYYCSFECMQSNWPNHRLYCSKEVPK